MRNLVNAAKQGFWDAAWGPSSITYRKQQNAPLAGVNVRPDIPARQGAGKNEIEPEGSCPGWRFSA